MWEQLKSASSEAGTYPGPGLLPHDGNHLLARRRPGWRAYLASAQTLGGPDGLGNGWNNCRQTNETRKSKFSFRSLEFSLFSDYFLKLSVSNDNSLKQIYWNWYIDLRKSVRLIARFEVGACLNWRWGGMRCNCFPQFPIRLPGVISFHIFHLNKKCFGFALTFLQENWQLKCNSQHAACSGGQTIFHHHHQDPAKSTSVCV